MREPATDAAARLTALRAERDSYPTRFANACRAAHDAGLSIADIARHAGVSRPAIYRALDRHKETA